MKIYISLLLILLILLFISCSSIQNSSIGKKVIYEFIGTFDSEYHSDGEMNWTLFTDGSLVGSWSTENKTYTIEINGFYIINSDLISISAFGQSMLRAESKSNVMIFGQGYFSKNKANGIFYIFIENPDFPNDKGTWTVTVK